MAKKQKKKVDLEKIAAGVRLMLEGMGEDPERDGLQRTPERVADFYAELTEGMWQDAKAEIVPLPGDSHDEMVIVKDISIASVCEHHLAPFVGKCHIAYIPKNGRIVGLSKLARIAEIFAKRLQVQERLTQQIANTLFDELRTARRDGRDGSRAYLYDSARRKKARFENDHVGCSRRFPQRCANTRRSDEFD